MITALRLELTYSKDEVLAMFAGRAPFGGNVVGLEAASWRYFGPEPGGLSWAESAMLAVLPNNPSLIHPGRNRDLLAEKRNRLLDRLRDEGIIDRLACDLAKQEGLPPKPRPLPMLAPNLLAYAQKTGQKGQRVLSTLDISVQVRALEIIERHHMKLASEGILNAAAIILDVETGGVGACVGNADVAGRPCIAGSRAAALIMFDLFDMLDKSRWFKRPDSDLVYIEVCSKSGCRAGIYCEEAEYNASTKKGLKTDPCPYCRRIHLDDGLEWQVDSQYEKVSQIQTRSWFVLPPHRPDCAADSGGQRHSSISIIYPGPDSSIYVPLGLDSERGKIVFQAAHRDPDARIFWHLDSRYAGTT